jgi:prepilin-type N-terminal cleavage/methylation domain-containing protein
MQDNDKNTGFTIVELLIVIVVIAVLAAISIVAYNGIQNRANDTVVRADLRNFANKVQQYNAQNGQYPPAGSKSGNSTVFPGMTFTPSKSAYMVTQDNFFYCDGLKSGVSGFVVTARSKSGREYAYDTYTGGLKDITGSGIYAYCSTGWDASTNGYSYGYHFPTSTWYAWTN